MWICLESWLIGVGCSNCTSFMVCVSMFVDVCVCVSPGLCLDCVWENIYSAIATLHKHYKLHGTHIMGVKCLSTEREKQIGRERIHKYSSTLLNTCELLYVQSPHLRDYTNCKVLLCLCLCCPPVGGALSLCMTPL